MDQPSPSGYTSNINKELGVDRRAESMYVPKRTNKKGSGSREKSKGTMDKSIGQGETGDDANAKSSKMKEYNLMVSSTKKPMNALATV